MAGRHARKAEELVVSAGELAVTRLDAEGQPCLQVPLVVSGGRRTEGIDLFEGGVLWEDERADLSLVVETAAELAWATLSVNDHSDLRLWFDVQATLAWDDGLSWRYELWLNPDAQGDQYDRPFNLTCGFARVRVHLHFRDGSDACLETPDIVCLDEPGDARWEREEERNVREMYRTLTKPDDNQAGEWMFGDAPTTFGADLLSDDDDTDWAHAGLSRLLGVASDVLNLVYDGFEDEEDSFPNTTSDPDAHSPYDTPENRAVRALLVSLLSRTADVCREVEAAKRELEGLCAKLERLVQVEGSRRKTSQSLPALVLLREQLRQERTWALQARDLVERSEDSLADFDRYLGGSEAVGHEPFGVPEASGLYASDERYAELHTAMCVWESARAERVLRGDASLYAIKPDRLFEYYALHRMLDWLWRAGFAEDRCRETPIARYEYRLEDRGSGFSNEWRCNNSFHLCRPVGKGAVEEVSLYYQPVAYGVGEMENGVDLRRVGAAPQGLANAWWTPDYLLVVRDARSVRHYVIDAKYCAWSRLGGRSGRLGDCVEKYVRDLRVASVVTDGIRRSPVVDGVWILSGRKDSGKLTWQRAVEGGLADADWLPEGTDVVCGIAPCNCNAGQRKMGQFFAQLGLRRA